MRAVALAVCLTFLGCFPNNARHRTYAKLVEGGVLIGGISLLAFSNTQADCDMEVGLGMPREDCKSRAGLISGIGLTMVLLGLVGFAATTTTAVDTDPATTTTTPSTTPTTSSPTAPAAPPSTTPTPIGP
jgi:hypothetical protein